MNVEHVSRHSIAKPDWTSNEKQRIGNWELRIGNRGLEDLGIRALFWVLSVGFWVRCQIIWTAEPQNNEPQNVEGKNFCCSIPFKLDSIFDIRILLWTLNPELWTLNFEPWTVNPELWTLNCELWTHGKKQKSYSISLGHCPCFGWNRGILQNTPGYAKNRADQAVFFDNVFHTFLFLFSRCVAYRRGSKKALW